MAISKQLIFLRILFFVQKPVVITFSFIKMVVRLYISLVACKFARLTTVSTVTIWSGEFEGVGCTFVMTVLPIHQQLMATRCFHSRGLLLSATKVAWKIDAIAQGRHNFTRVRGGAVWPWVFAKFFQIFGIEYIRGLVTGHAEQYVWFEHKFVHITFTWTTLNDSV